MWKHETSDTFFFNLCLTKKHVYALRVFSAPIFTMIVIQKFVHLNADFWYFFKVCIHQFEWIELNKKGMGLYLDWNISNICTTIST